MLTKERITSGVVTFLGLFFLVTAFLKGLDSSLFAYTVLEHFGLMGIDLSPRFSLLISQIVVLTELLVGLGLSLNVYRRASLFVCLALIILFSIELSVVYIYSDISNCGCMGNLVPMGLTATLLKNFVILLLVVFAIHNYKQACMDRLDERLTTFVMMIWVIPFMCISLFDQPLKDIALLEKFPVDDIYFPIGHIHSKREIYAVVHDFNKLSPDYTKNLMSALGKYKEEYGANLSVLTNTPQKEIPEQIEGNVSVGKLSRERLSALCDSNVGIVVVRDGRMVAIWRQSILLPDKFPENIMDIAYQSSFMLLIVKVLIWLFYFVFLLIVKREILINIMSNEKKYL